MQTQRTLPAGRSGDLYAARENEEGEGSNGRKVEPDLRAGFLRDSKTRPEVAFHQRYREGRQCPRCDWRQCRRLPPVWDRF